MRNRKILFAVSAVFLVSVCLSVFILMPSEQQTVEIVQDGAVLYTFDLRRAEDREIRIASADGGYNLIVINSGTICISEADCPDQTCVRSGKLKSGYLPIVCLPHRLIVRFTEEES